MLAALQCRAFYCVQERGPFSERAAARVVYEALKTVAACHARNVIHGDVKPANFLMGTGRKGNMIYISDFGVAKEYERRANYDHDDADPSTVRVVGTTRFAIIAARTGSDMHSTLFFSPKKLRMCQSRPKKTILRPWDIWGCAF